MLYVAGADAVRAEYATRDAEAAEASRLLARDRTLVNQRIDHDHITRQAAAARAAAADRSAVGELRDALAAAARDTGDPAAAGCADERRTIGVLAGLVADGAGLLAAGAERGAGIEAQASGLRDYVARVCQSPVTATPDRPTQ
jgi:hypothetical protein